MNDQIKQIAERLAGLRESLDLTEGEMAEMCNLTSNEYRALESGERDIPVSVLHNICQNTNVELSALMFGDDPHATSYFLTRKGNGATVERTKVYHYESLAAGFAQRKADPFIVTVEPKPDGTPIHLNTHSGQEFNLILSGKMRLHINGKDLALEEGDSIYFNSSLPHGMLALDEQPVRFLAIIF